MMYIYVSGERVPFWKRVYGVIWGSPARTLEYIVQKPDFLGAGALILGANLAMTMIQLPKIKEFTYWTLQNMPAEVRYSAENMDVVVNVAAFSALAASAALPPALWVVTAALLKLFNVFTGERARFKSLFAVTVFANLPVVLDSMIKTVLVLATPARNITKITISPALFLPPQDLVPGKMYVFLSHFDPIIVWSLVLTALGGSRAMNVPFWKTFIYVTGLWLLYVAGMTAISGMGGV